MRPYIVKLLPWLLLCSFVWTATGQKMPHLDRPFHQSFLDMAIGNHVQFVRAGKAEIAPVSRNWDNDRKVSHGFDSVLASSSDVMPCNALRCSSVGRSDLLFAGAETSPYSARAPPQIII
ncbi:MAG: hypothetical protein KIT67_23985 [Alphaproteobacteria bacterium]|nr:hypothetical protein [Alphaproteobacteria bacterium]